MQANCAIVLSGNVKQELLPTQELFELDQKISGQYQNEKAFREDSKFQQKIQNFFDLKRAYRNAILDLDKKQGRIALEYKGMDGYNYFLAPLYQEDLKLLRMKELNLEVFVSRIKNKIDTILREKDSATLETFFRKNHFLFVSMYEIKQGYNNWIRDLYSSGKTRDRAQSKLLSMLRRKLTIDTQGNRERIYFRARVVYDYIKKHNLLKTDTISTSTAKKSATGQVKIHQVFQPEVATLVVKGSKVGNRQSFEEYFLDANLQAQKNKSNTNKEATFAVHDSLNEQRERRH